MNPIFLKFKSSGNWQDLIINFNHIVEVRPYSETETTIFLSRGQDYAIVHCPFDDVCKAISNWSVVDGSYCK